MELWSPVYGYNKQLYACNNVVLNNNETPEPSTGVTIIKYYLSNHIIIGGLNHWFHSFERLLPHFVNTLRNSYDLFEGDNYNSHNRSTFPNGREEIYLVFSEKWAVSSLGLIRYVCMYLCIYVCMYNLKFMDGLHGLICTTNCIEIYSYMQT